MNKSSRERADIEYGAAIATSGRLGIGKMKNYSYDIYEVEFIPETLFGSVYRKSLTTLFEEMGIDMYFDGSVDEDRIRQLPINSVLKQEEITQMIKESMR